MTAISVLPPVLTPEELTAYAALRTDAVWFESPGQWSAFRGDKAANALNGLVTNDVASLAVGDSVYAAALSPKGKMVADMLIARFDDATFLIYVLPAVAASWLALARKYVNPRLCKVTDESDHYRSFMVYGARAVHAIDAALEGIAARRFTAPLMGSISGTMLLADASQAEQVLHRVQSSSLTRGTPNLWNVLRVEAGRPVMGTDMDENTIPQEANLDTLGAISFSKGCYTGQETVARLHFRGHVNKHLRGLRSDFPLPLGAEISDATGKGVGDVRSSATSPSLGAIALAMIRREVAAGDQTTVATGEGSIVARVVDLPFE